MHQSDDTTPDNVRPLRPVGADDAPYTEFAPEFARALAYLCAQNATVWHTVGCLLDPDKMPDKRVGLVLKMCRHVERDTGEGPGSISDVMQAMERARAAGKLRRETMVHTAQLFDEVEDARASVPSVKSAIAQTADVLRVRRERQLLQEMQASVGKGEPLAEYAHRLDALSRLGVVEHGRYVDTDDHAVVWSRIESMSRVNRLPTPVHAVNEQLRGGWAAGTLSVWGAGTNVGKTAMMVHQAVLTSLLGYRVIFVPMEESVEETLVRMVACMTGTPTTEVEAAGGGVRQAYADVVRSGAMVVEHLSQGSTTGQLEELIDRVCRTNPKFRDGWDVVYLDYPDKMGLNEGRGRDARVGTYEKMGVIYDDLRKIAHTAKKWVVVGSQLKEYDGVPTTEALRDSRRKGDVADNVVLMYREKDSEHTDRWYHIGKARGPGAGEIVGPVGTDTDRARMVDTDDRVVDLLMAGRLRTDDTDLDW